MPRVYRSKHLAAMHERYGITEGETCGTCGRLIQGRCPYDYKCGHWNRAWQACGQWSQWDASMNGWEWVETPTGWVLRAKKGTS